MPKSKAAQVCPSENSTMDQSARVVLSISRTNPNDSTYVPASWLSKYSRKRGHVGECPSEASVVAGIGPWDLDRGGVFESPIHPDRSVQRRRDAPERTIVILTGVKDGE